MPTAFLSLWRIAGRRQCAALTAFCQPFSLEDYARELLLATPAAERASRCWAERVQLSAYAPQRSSAAASLLHPSSRQKQQQLATVILRPSAERWWPLVIASLQRDACVGACTASADACVLSSLDYPYHMLRRPDMCARTPREDAAAAASDVKACVRACGRAVYTRFG